MFVSAEDGRSPEPPEVQIFRPSEEECRNKKDNGRKKTLVCVASRFYPDHVSVSWQKNGNEVKDGVATDTAAVRPEGEEFYRISSRLRVSAETWFDPNNNFMCLVKFFNGSNHTIHSETVYGDPGESIEGAGGSPMSWLAGK